MSKKYRLLKDLPEVKAGEIYFPQPGSNNWYVSKSNSLYHAATVENNPEWFEEVKDEKITVTVVNNGFCGEMVSIRPNRSEWKIPVEKNKAIKEAIENVLNPKDYGENLAIMMPDKFQPLYTKQQVDKLMEDAFDAAKEWKPSDKKSVEFPMMISMIPKYINFQDYKNTIPLK